MKKDFTVYHVVTNKKMKVGQKLVFDNNEKNTLYQFFFEKEQRNSNQQNFTLIITNNYINNQIQLNEEDSKVSMQYLEQTIRAVRETIVEMVRLEHYPQYPSRLSCLYTTRTYADALEWKKIFDSFNRKVLQIVKLKVQGTYFEGDGNLLPSNDSLPFDKKIEQAKTYWNGNKENNLPELLVNGNIEVIDIIEDYTIN